MTKNFSINWDTVSEKIYLIANNDRSDWLNEGQRRSLRAIAERITQNGVIIADEVGMGKTRIAVTLTHCVKSCGGRVAVLIPPGLGYQWRNEMRDGGVETLELLRSLWGYLEVWSADSKTEWKPWYEESVVLISHAFANWRIGDGAAAWRLALVPELLARWRKEVHLIRFPNGYHTHQDLNDWWESSWVKNAGISIADYAMNHDRLAKSQLENLYNEIDWDLKTLLKGKFYQQGDDLRSWLEKCVGVGLGCFDLVIIDEAHKSRCNDSGLSRLLEEVVLQHDNCRRIAMTATPVEINVSQWRSMLNRICVDEKQIDDIQQKAIQPYIEAVTNLKRSWLISPLVREKFIAASKCYQDSMTPYLLRRDKREEKIIQHFRERIGGTRIESYRRRSEAIIDPKELTSSWREALFSAEALSILTSQSDDIQLKRLRLTMGNGHGISAVLDNIYREYSNEALEEKDENFHVNDLSLQDRKRKERADWWKGCMVSALGNSGNLFEHPSIIKAIEIIEKEHENNEKVLVFGRFTKPLQALTQLLNARAMLVCLDKGEYWPQSKVPDDENADSEVGEWAAIRAAHQQLESNIELDSMNRLLARQYKKLENQRERFRNALPKLLKEGLAEYRNVLLKFLVEWLGLHNENNAIIAHGITEYLDVATDKVSSGNVLKALDQLYKDMLGEDESELSRNGDAVFDKLINRMEEEFGRQQGRFARLMNGSIPMSTRRLLQSAFNRDNSPTRVLVAQSMVGREGLNLHQACRVVLLLHPEWNPGVVEQQIGRVDRVGSRWEKLFNQVDTKFPAGQIIVKEELPHIEIKPIIFRGTYDEYNWQVLKERWSELRSQLHGEIISDEILPENEDEKRILQKITESAPSFSPKQ